MHFCPVRFLPNPLRLTMNSHPGRNRPGAYQGKTGTRQTRPSSQTYPAARWYSGCEAPFPSCGEMRAGPVFGTEGRLQPPRLFRIFFLFLLPAAFQTSYQLSGGTGQPLTAGSWFFFNFNGSERKKSSKKITRSIKNHLFSIRSSIANSIKEIRKIYFP